MSSNPLVPSFRYPFESEIAGLPVEHQQVLRTLFNCTTDLYQANAQVSADIKALKGGTTSGTGTTTNVNTTAENTTIITQNNVGFVNDQTGNVAYTTQQSDYGSFVLFGDASAIAVILSSGPGIQVPWYCLAINFGTSTVTFTPASGTISFGTTSAAGSMALLAGYFAIISFDGTNFFSASLPLVPATFTPVANEFLTGYSATSGNFSAAQPSFANISGTVAPSQLPDPTLTTLGGVEAIAPVASEWINQIDTSGVPHLSQPSFSDISGNLASGQLPTAGITGTVTLAALTTLGTQGSISYVNGQITAVVDPT